MVKESNTAHTHREPWIVSLLMERWLMNAFTKKEWTRIADAIGTEFKVAAGGMATNRSPYAQMKGGQCRYDDATLVSSKGAAGMVPPLSFRPALSGHVRQRCYKPRFKLDHYRRISSG